MFITPGSNYFRAPSYLWLAKKNRHYHFIRHQVPWFLLRVNSRINIFGNWAATSFLQRYSWNDPERNGLEFSRGKFSRTFSRTFLLFPLTRVYVVANKRIRKIPCMKTEINRKAPTETPSPTWLVYDFFFSSKLKKVEFISGVRLKKFKQISWKNLPNSYFEHTFLASVSSRHADTFYCFNFLSCFCKPFLCVTCLIFYILAINSTTYKLVLICR